MNRDLKTIIKSNSFLMSFHQRYIEFKEHRTRRNPPAHSGEPRYALAEEQVYPVGSNFNSALLKYMQKEYANIDFSYETPVASIGSCFAEHFANHMISNGFNYIQREKNTWNTSANWGRVYTIPNLSQIIDYSLDNDFQIILEQTSCRSWKNKQQGWFDPLRDNSPTHVDVDSAKLEIETHRKESRIVFQTARLIVITLGQNEGWKDSKNGIVWANRPPQDIFDSDPSRFIFETFEQSYIVNSLKESLKKLIAINPNIQFIVTVSPVPAFATFHNRDVIIDSFANKALLRVVIEEITRQFSSQVMYFPSFEMVLAYNPYSFRADNRHVMPSIANRILDTFDKALQLSDK